MNSLLEPLNERDTIFFFNAIQEYTAWRIAYCDRPFPDAIISNGYETLLAEFEYKASNFVNHGHDPQGCDLIICWLNDWKDAPISILALSEMVLHFGIEYDRREKKGNLDRWRSFSFKTDDITFKRIVALAEQEDRTVSKMLHILVIEALNQRECSAAIRQADNPEIDMRFCSPHCRHNQDNICHNSIVANNEPPYENAVLFSDAGVRDFRHGECPYALQDFQWWQRGADEDTRAEAEYKKRWKATSDEEAD